MHAQTAPYSAIGTVLRTTTLSKTVSRELSGQETSQKGPRRCKVPPMMARLAFPATEIVRGNGREIAQRMPAVTAARKANAKNRKLPSFCRKQQPRLHKMPYQPNAAAHERAPADRDPPHWRVLTRPADTTDPDEAEIADCGAVGTVHDLTAYGTRCTNWIDKTARPQGNEE